MLDSTPDMGAPDGSILGQSMITSNEVIDARDSVDARDSQMNSDSKNEKNLDDLLNCAESLEHTRVCRHNKPKKISISVMKNKVYMQPFIFCIFFIVTIICATNISRFWIQLMQITSAMRKMTLLLNESVAAMMVIGLLWELMMHLLHSTTLNVFSALPSTWTEM